MISRDLLAAREAFDRKDPRLSQAIHSQKIVEAGHDGDPISLKSAVFGGFEGLIVSATIIHGLGSVQLEPSSLVTMALTCHLILSLGCALRALSRHHAESQNYWRERAREKWEMTHYPEGERKEMIELYVKKYSISDHDAHQIIDMGSKYEEFFVELMMLQELQLLLPDSSPFLSAITGGVSYLFFGLWPLASYFILYSTAEPRYMVWLWSYISAQPLILVWLFISLAFILHYACNRLILPNQNHLTTHMEMFFTTVACSVLAWIIGHAVSDFVTAQFASELPVVTSLS